MKIIKYLKSPSKIILYLMNKNFFWWLDDEKYLKLRYRLITKSKLNLENPETFNEKIQWLKIHDRKLEYTKMADKYKVREYIQEKIGKEYLIPLIGLYNKFDDIDFEKLPNQFVIKCTHDSGGLVVCTDKSKLNIKETKNKINKCISKNFYCEGREWPYKNIKPRIIIEKYIKDESKKGLKDYKLFCFHGKVKMILVCSNRFIKLEKTFFDEKWNRINLTEGEHDVNITLQKPYNFEKMKELAERLSKNMKFLRVDFYEVNRKIYFGELTFYPNSGYEKFEPDKWNKKLGNMINLYL